MFKGPRDMLGSEYERAAGGSVPLSQSGGVPGRGCPEQSLIMRCQKEQCATEGTMCCRAYLDLGVCFMSCVRKVQWEVERWCGVRPEVSETVRALHESGSGTVGRYETAYGLTEPFDMRNGNLQGCSQSPTRSKMQVRMIQEAVNSLCVGFRFRGAEGSIVQSWLIDDGAFMVPDLASLQLVMDTCWMVTRAAGLRMMIKKDTKTAWQASYWKDGVEHEVDDWEMYRLLCAAGADGPGAAPPPSSNTRANDQAGGAGLAGTAAAGGSTGSTQQKPGAAGSAATGPAASAAADGTTGAPRQKPGAGAGTTATGAAHSASRGEAQQMQAVEDDPYCNPDDENTWEAKEYNRDDPEHGNVIYYDVERKYKNDCRKRGGRFDWACLMWFGDAAEPDTIKLLDSKYKRKPCQPTKRWSAKEDRYALCFADRDNKAGRSASAAGTGGGGGGKVPAAAGGSCTRFCTSCGAAVSTAFCGKCGAPVN